MTKDTIAGLRAWMHEPDYIEDGFSLESVVAWINRRPIGAFEQMASELATLRESLAKAEEARSTWHRLAIDMSTERDDALARAAALQSKVEKLTGALEPFANMLPDTQEPKDALQRKLQEWCRRARALAQGEGA